MYLVEQHMLHDNNIHSITVIEKNNLRPRY